MFTIIDALRFASFNLWGLVSIPKSALNRSLACCLISFRVHALHLIFVLHDKILNVRGASIWFAEMMID